MNNKPEHQEKQIVYVDMDNVLVDFPSAVDRLPQETFEKYKGHYDEVPGIFATMEPIKGALEAYRYLAEHFDVYILSTAPWRNPSAWSDKLLWVQHYLGDVAYKRLILTHHMSSFISWLFISFIVASIGVFSALCSVLAKGSENS